MGKSHQGTVTFIGYGKRAQSHCSYLDIIFDEILCFNLWIHLLELRSKGWVTGPNCAKFKWSRAYLGIYKVHQ